VERVIIDLTLIKISFNLSCYRSIDYRYSSQASVLRKSSSSRPSYVFIRPPFLGLGLVEFVHGHQLAHNIVLFGEALLPALKGLHLVLAEALELVQGPVEVLGQHLLVEAAAGEATGGIATGKVGVGPAGPVKVAAARNVEDLAANGEEDLGTVLTVEGQERARRVRAEDGGRCGRRQRRGRRSAEDGVARVGEDAEEDEVDGTKEAAAARVGAVSSWPETFGPRRAGETNLRASAASFSVDISADDKANA
jgi:hypothetical protein